MSGPRILGVTLSFYVRFDKATTQSRFQPKATDLRRHSATHWSPPTA
jgi:hypothetical protein